MKTENFYQETDLGNISPNPRGDYDASAEYEYLDQVFMGGGSYLCRAEFGAKITGIAPEPGKTTNLWQCVAIPGDLTPEYIAMHDDVVNRAESVSEDAKSVEEMHENVIGMETNVREIQKQTEQFAEDAESSKDGASGYAREAEASRQAASESEANINAQVAGFDTHVEEKTEESIGEVDKARRAAIGAVTAQQTASIREVKDQTSEFISQKQADAENAIEDKADEYKVNLNFAIKSIQNAGNNQVKNVEDVGSKQVAELQKYKGVKISDAEPTEEEVGVWIDPNDDEEYQIPEIKDDEESEVDTWSSKKIKEGFSALKGDLDTLRDGGIVPFMTNFFDLDYGINRFNGNVTNGILKKDGTINPDNTNYCTTDYIYCADMVGKYPIFSVYRTNLDIWFTFSYQVICFYDVSHKLLSKNGFYGGSNVKPDSTVVPAGSVYLRFSTFTLLTYPTDVFQLTFEETKTGPTVYTDYLEPKETIKQKHIVNTNTDTFRDITERYSLDTSKFMQSCAKTPMITWVDDDCNYNSIANVKSLCDELDIKCTFGCITRDLSTAKTLDRLKEYQSNGFHITSHTHTHDRWYKDTTSGGMFTIDECETDLITSLVALRENGFLDGDMMIFSGGSAQRDGIEEIVSKWCRCAVKTNGIVNHLYGDGRYFIRRVFINKSKGYDYYKGLIDDAISNGDWLVFGSHSYDTSETGFDFDLMRNILMYAKSQNVEIMTLNKAYKIRKAVYDFYELFQ